MESLEGAKAPGLDGFNFALFKACWEIVHPDVLRFIKEFHQDGIINKGLKNSFTTIIPKREGPSELSCYRPISLVGSIYKLLAKVLAERLKKALPEVIGDSQVAFIENRQILDGVLIANELIHMRKERKPGLLFKIDMEKAYDCVDESFVGYLFEKMAFEK